MNIQGLKAKENGSFAFLIPKPIVKRRMASEDFIFTSSSDSEDSKVNFIADYELEVEGSPNSSNQDGGDLDKELEVYADKPLADDEWLAIYIEERKTDEELEKQLQYRKCKWLVAFTTNKHASVSTIICVCDHWLNESFYTTFPGVNV